MRPYFEKMKDWGKPVKVNEKNAEEIKKVEAEIAALVEANKNAGLAKEVLNKRGEWTVHHRGSRHLGSSSHTVRPHAGRVRDYRRCGWSRQDKRQVVRNNRI
jgi:hypothetical protein